MRLPTAIITSDVATMKCPVPVCQSGAPAEQTVEGIADLQLGLRVDAGGGLVEDQKARIVR